MSANSTPAKAVAVGTSAVLVSAWNANKRYTMVQATTANAQLIYVGSAGVTTAQGFGELAGGEAVTLWGSAAVYAIAGGAAQEVRVLEGFA